MAQVAHMQPVAAQAKRATAFRQTLQRKCACGEPASALSDECAGCGQQRAFGLRAKGYVSRPTDGCEREADRLAKQVMSMPDGELNVAASRDGATRTTPTVLDRQNAREGPAPLMVRSREAQPMRSTEESGAASGVMSPLKRLRLHGGVSLEDEVRDFMEPRFGHDFGHVRVHTGPLAAQAARSANALAFTFGRDIVFRDGQYRPRTLEGRRLIAHELAHVIQHDATVGGRPSILRVACPGECLECPPDGVVPEGCECLGEEKPKTIVAVPVPVRIVRLDGASSDSTIRRGIRQANRTWQAAGIELDARIHSINRTDSEKILGTDEHGRVRSNVEIEPEDLALNSDSTRALLGLPTPTGNEQFSVPAGQSPHNVVVYYVPEFNSCDKESGAIGCAFSGTHHGRYFVLIERRHQDVALAHELGHIWGNDHVEDKRNVMHPAPGNTGLTAQQIRTARRLLSLGSLRCLGKGKSETDRERVEEEQQLGQLLLLLIEGHWAGSVSVNGTPHDSTIDFEANSAANIHGIYWYDKLDGSKAGGVLDGAVVAGRLDYEWRQTAGGETSGKGSFALTSIYPPFTLSGRWGVGESRNNGGEWTVTLDESARASR
jgi:hypothetical protein